MINLKEALQIAYKSGAISHRTAAVKRLIVSLEAKKWRILQFNSKIEDDKIYYEKVKTIFANLSISHGWAMKFFETGIEGSSVKRNIESLWVDMGFPIDELPDWNFYKKLDLAFPITFSERPPKEIEDLEKIFKSDADELRNYNNWEDKFIVLFDSFTHDIWREESMRRWVNSNLDRSNELQKHLDIWDWMITESGKFFALASGTCITGLNRHVVQFYNPSFNELQNKTEEIRNKYIYNDFNSVIAAGGMYAIDIDDLPDEWKAKVENINIVYND